MLKRFKRTVKHVSRLPLDVPHLGSGGSIIQQSVSAGLYHK